MLFTKAKVPSLNLEPDQTMRMRLWSNIIRFCKDRFCVVAQVTSPVFLLSNTKEKLKLHALLHALKLHSQIPTQPYQSLSCLLQ